MTKPWRHAFLPIKTFPQDADTVSVKTYRRKHGFSLVEVLIGGLILAVLGAAFTRFMALSTRQSRDVASTNEANSSLLQLESALRRPAICRCNLTPSGASARSFPAASAAASVFALSRLQLFDDTCASAGPDLAKVATQGEGSENWVSAMQMKNFFRLNDTSYYGVVEVTVSRRPGSMGRPTFSKEYPVFFVTTTAGGTVTLVDCEGTGPGGPITTLTVEKPMVATSVSFPLLPGATHALVEGMGYNQVDPGPTLKGTNEDIDLFKVHVNLATRTHSGTRLLAGSSGIPVTHHRWDNVAFGTQIPVLGYIWPGHNGQITVSTAGGNFTISNLPGDSSGLVSYQAHQVWQATYFR